MEPIDPALFERADLRAALAGHEIGAVYRALQDLGVSQRWIAALTGQCQSDVAAGAACGEGGRANPLARRDWPRLRPRPAGKQRGGGEWASGLLGVPGTEAVKRSLLTGVAELQIRAGWEAFDAGLYDRAVYHYQRGLELATETGDTYCQTLALNCAGLAHMEHGHPNDGLKVLQIAQVKAREIALGDERIIGEGSRAALAACARADSATALAQLGNPEAANAALAESRELWQPTSADPGGDLDQVAARLELGRGQLDAAQAFATR